MEVLITVFLRHSWKQNKRLKHVYSPSHISILIQKKTWNLHENAVRYSFEGH